MKIITVGGGPGGLYASLLLAKADPSRDITLYERNARGATYGWGVVFSDRTLSSFREADAETYEQIIDAFVMWDVIEVRVDDSVVRCGGQVFSGISRRALLEILNQRCEELGVVLRFGTEFDRTASDPPDLLIAADGIRSALREADKDVFRPRISKGRSRYIWFGTTCPFDSFTFIFRRSEHGLFQAHVYPFDGEMSTFIVECDETTWRRAGLDTADETESIAFCSGMFADDLAGHPLMSNQSDWLTFATLRTRSWWHDNLVLLGDAAHTAHFSIGSGTKLAMEDAIALARVLDQHDTRDAALAAYELERKAIVGRFQEAAAQSRDYFESTSRHIELQPEQFIFHLLTRSGRVDYDELRLKDAGLIDRVDRWFSAQAGSRTLVAPPPVLAPVTIGGARLDNRIVDIPHSSNGGATGAGLSIVGDVCVSEAGRITPESPVLYLEEHVGPWKRLTEQGGMKVAVRLLHAGRRGATRPRTEGLDRPLAQGWPLIAPSAIAYGSNSKPRQMHRPDMDGVRDAFVFSAGLASKAGFDVVGIDMARGYLLGGFISPVTNRRDDRYGGDLMRRLRFPLEVFAAVRSAWTGPLFASVCASDEVRGGTRLEDALVLASALKDGGCDLIEVTTGYTVPNDRIRYDPYSLPSLADRIRNECDIPVLIARPVASVNRINTLVASGRTDLCVLLPEAVKVEN